MKTLRFFCFALLFLLGLGSFSLAQAQTDLTPWFQATQTFLQAQVSDGKIDYASLKASPTELQQLIDQIATVELKGQTPEVRKAFLINAYNLLVIQGVVTAYPIESPQEVPSFFDRKAYVVGGKKYSLNGLEKEWAFKEFPDARLHFALVCGANGCPPIRPEAYFPELLETQLDQQAKLALNDPAFVQIDHMEKTIGYSQIFRWYKSDFVEGGEELSTYVNQYRETPLPAGYETTFYEYDWTVNAPLPDPRDLLAQKDEGKTNIQIYTPSVLLKRGQVRFQMFHNLYTQTGFRDGNGKFVDLERRETFYTGIFRLDFGLTKRARWNVGIEGNLQGVRYDGNPNSSALRYLSGTETDLLAQRTALTTLGPRIRFQPIARVPNFSVTSIFYFPLANDLERPEDFGFLSHNRATWWTQFFYDKTWDKYQLFLELDVLYRFKTNQHSFRQEAFFRTPIVAFLSYFPTPKATLNINYQFAPAFSGLPGNENGTKFGPVSAFMQAGVGAKYQVTPAINLEVLYTNFFASWNDGAGQTFNIGLVFIR
ncbi:MAG: DUF547 domain-containing protein [Bacteroidota bacterium]